MEQALLDPEDRMNVPAAVAFFNSCGIAEVYLWLLSENILGWSGRVERRDKVSYVLQSNLSSIAIICEGQYARLLH